MPTYPYVASGGLLVKAFEQLRKNFPAKVDAAYLKRFQIAPSNESYVIGILRFLNLIDEEGNKRTDKTDFFLGNDDKFQAGLDGVLRDAYAELISEMGDEAYKASREDLGHWFRGADKTSDLVGKRQALTFLALASLAGKGDSLPAARVNPGPPKVRVPAASKAAANGKSVHAVEKDVVGHGGGRDTPKASGVGLTVRVEVNLPAGGDAATYDAIFASIKRHLLP